LHASSSPLLPSSSAALQDLHARILACRSCCRAGLLEQCAPVLSEPIASPVVLVGQAPGRLEQKTRRPFSGRAGRELFRWLQAAGLGDEEEARAAVYLTSMTKCFPGPARSGSGDRRPRAAEIELCRPHLDSQLRLLDPWLLIAVGQLAITRFLGEHPMDDLVGRVYLPSGVELRPGLTVPFQERPLVLPLPHPSGASRWLNQVGHRAQLEAALSRLRQLLEARPELSGRI
jgi:uracil-DNA glycosylase family 4